MTNYIYRGPGSVSYEIGSEKKVAEYFIVRGGNLADFEKKINEMLAVGWELHGYMFSSCTASYLQAMIRR